MISSNKAILVGQIVGVHGINGTIKLRSYTENPTNIIKYKLFFEDKTEVKLQYLFTKLPNLICKINEINNRNDAETLVGYKIFTERDYLPEIIDQDEFYLNDLMNLKVQNQNQQTIGQVKNILNFGAGDLIEIEFNNGKSEIFRFTQANFPIIEKTYVVFQNSQKDE